MKIRFRYQRALPCYRDRGKPNPSDLRPYSRKRGWNYFPIPPYPRGGHTLCEIIDDNGEVVANGEAWCSMADAFNYKRGRAIAEGRARKSFTEKYGLPLA